ncbi:MAG: TSUP family transporter [Halieaceae bacterium]
MWGGFVRSGLGFGGAVLTLPFLLLILDQPLVFLPIIGLHLMIFSSLTVWQSHRSEHSATTVNWPFLKWALLVMAIPKAIGVMGVITLPGELISGFIFIIVTVYSISYILDRPIRSKNKYLDTLLMALGGYVSGTSLIAAPLVVPVAASRVPREQLRDTLFALWFILVLVKLAAFMAAGVDMQWREHLWLLPCATIGHVLGLRFHDYTLRANTAVFFRIIGCGLLAVSLVGLTRIAL